jgi:CRISPR type III-A-associated protein Csm2
MIQFYKDDKGTINPLFIEKAYEDSQNILNVSPTQMRRIFNQIKNIEQKIDKNGWDKIEPIVRLQKAQILYTVKRNIDKEKKFENDWLYLKKLITGLLDNIKSASDYKTFAMYMEALYAYHYSETKRDK